MSHQLVAETATRTTHNKHKSRKKHALSGIQTHDFRRLQTYGFAHTATGTGSS